MLFLNNMPTKKILTHDEIETETSTDLPSNTKNKRQWDLVCGLNSQY